MPGRRLEAQASAGAACGDQRAPGRPERVRGDEVRVEERARSVRKSTSGDGAPCDAPPGGEIHRATPAAPHRLPRRSELRRRCRVSEVRTAGGSSVSDGCLRFGRHPRAVSAGGARATRQAARRGRASEATSCSSITSRSGHRPRRRRPASACTRPSSECQSPNDSHTRTPRRCSPETPRRSAAPAFACRRGTLQTSITSFEPRLAEALSGRSARRPKSSRRAAGRAVAAGVAAVELLRRFWVISAERLLASEIRLGDRRLLLLERGLSRWLRLLLCAQLELTFE